MASFAYSRGLRWPVAVMAMGGLALLAACGSGQSTSAVGSPAGRSAPQTSTHTGGMPGMRMSGSSGTAPQGAPVASNTVSIKGFAFAPATVSVTAGTTVTWTNKDEEPHTVAATGGQFRSSPLTSGKTFRYTFTKPGRYSYLCTIHPFMRGTVVVTR